MARKIGPSVIRTSAGYSERLFFVKLGEDDVKLPLQTKKISGTIATSGGQPVDVLSNPYGAPIGFATPEEAVEKATEINRMNGK